MSDHDVRKWLDATDEEVGPACMNVPVPPTIANDGPFREGYEQGYCHALSDVREALKRRASPDGGEEHG